MDEWVESYNEKFKRRCWMNKKNGTMVWKDPAGGGASSDSSSTSPSSSVAPVYASSPSSNISSSGNGGSRESDSSSAKSIKTNSLTFKHMSIDGKYIKKGNLLKENKQGDKVNYSFGLSLDEFVYIEYLKPLDDDAARRHPLEQSMAIDLEPGDPRGADGKTFAFLSKTKSFLLTANNKDEKDIWVMAINTAATQKQWNILGRVLTPNDCCSLRSPKKNADKCELCFADFSFFSLRHHCQNCGKCVCNSCSRDKCRIPRLDSYKLYKVCSKCYGELKGQFAYKGGDAQKAAPPPVASPTSSVNTPTLAPVKAGLAAPSNNGRNADGEIISNSKLQDLNKRLSTRQMSMKDFNMILKEENIQGSDAVEVMKKLISMQEASESTPSTVTPEMNDTKSKSNSNSNINSKINSNNNSSATSINIVGNQQLLTKYTKIYHMFSESTIRKKMEIDGLDSEHCDYYIKLIKNDITEIPGSKPSSDRLQQTNPQLSPPKAPKVAPGAQTFTSNLNAPSVTSNNATASNRASMPRSAPPPVPPPSNIGPVVTNSNNSTNPFDEEDCLPNLPPPPVPPPPPADFGKSEASSSSASSSIKSNSAKAPPPPPPPQIAPQTNAKPPPPPVKPSTNHSSSSEVDITSNDSSIPEELKKYYKMRDMFPEGVVRQKMRVDGFDDDQIDSFISGGTLNVLSGADASTTTPAVTSSKPKPPPPPPGAKKSNDASARPPPPPPGKGLSIMDAIKGGGIQLKSVSKSEKQSAASELSIEQQKVVAMFKRRCHIKNDDSSDSDNSDFEP